MAHATVFKHTPDRRTNSATDNQQLSPTTGESCTWGLQLGGGAMKGTNSGGALTGGSRSWLMLGTVGYLLSCYSASSAREESPSSTRRIRQHRYFSLSCGVCQGTSRRMQHLLENLEYGKQPHYLGFSQNPRNKREEAHGSSTGEKHGKVTYKT